MVVTLYNRKCCRVSSVGFGAGRAGDNGEGSLTLAPSTRVRDGLLVLVMVHLLSILEGRVFGMLVLLRNELLRDGVWVAASWRLERVARHGHGSPRVLGVA